MRKAYSKELEKQAFASLCESFKYIKEGGMKMIHYRILNNFFLKTLHWIENLNMTN
jgi:hypothetical protein